MDYDKTEMPLTVEEAFPPASQRITLPGGAGWIEYMNREQKDFNREQLFSVRYSIVHRVKWNIFGKQITVWKRTYTGTAFKAVIGVKSREHSSYIFITDMKYRESLRVWFDERGKIVAVDQPR